MFHCSGQQEYPHPPVEPDLLLIGAPPPHKQNWVCLYDVMRLSMKPIYCYCSKILQRILSWVIKLLKMSQTLYVVGIVFLLHPGQWTTHNNSDNNWTILPWVAPISMSGEMKTASFSLCVYWAMDLRWVCGLEFCSSSFEVLGCQGGSIEFGKRFGSVSYDFGCFWKCLMQKWCIDTLMLLGWSSSRVTEWCSSI